MYRQITCKVPASNSSFSTCINDFLSFRKHFLCSRSSLGSGLQTELTALWAEGAGSSPGAGGRGAGSAVRAARVPGEPPCSGPAPDFHKHHQSCLALPTEQGQIGNPN